MAGGRAENWICSVTETVERWLPVMVTAPTPLLTTRVLTGAETVYVADVWDPPWIGRGLELVTGMLDARVSGLVAPCGPAGAGGEPRPALTATATPATAASTAVPPAACLVRLRRSRRLMAGRPGGSASRTGRSQAANSSRRSSSRISGLLLS